MYQNHALDSATPATIASISHAGMTMSLPAQAISAITVHKA